MEGDVKTPKSHIVLMGRWPEVFGYLKKLLFGESLDVLFLYRHFLNKKSGGQGWKYGIPSYIVTWYTPKWQVVWGKMMINH
jgi:hypothetical protein